MTIMPVVLIGVALAGATPDWWWVAGDSNDGAAVFVDAATAGRTGESAAIDIVRVDRGGARASATWRGRCDATQPNEEDRAVAAFACGNDETRMKTAAMLGGLTPPEAARAIFAGGGRGMAKSETAGDSPL